MSLENKEIISVTDLYEYLPNINCGKCGVGTCLAFAQKLIAGEFKLSRCVHMGEVSEVNKKEIENMLLSLGCKL